MTLITDRATEQIAAALAAQLEERGCRWNAFVLEDLAARPLADMPAGVLADMEDSEVSIFAVEVQPNELHSRMQMTDVVNRRHMRHAHMVNITQEIMCQGMRADYDLVDRLSQKILDRVRKATRIRATTSAGTDIAAEMNPNYKWFKTSGIIANKQLQADFWAYTHTDENSDRVGEFAIGTNLGVERVIGNILQDEKFPGIHIAFGNPYGEHTGAPWRSGTHIDVVGLGFNIWLESGAGSEGITEQIMRDGRFLITP